nr:glycine betaine ABC transporter substrate-binding protein [Glaciibacter superstes]
MTRRQALSLIAAGTTAAALAGCAGQADRDANTITVGSKGFTESWIMGELYAQLLRARDYTVALKTNVGSTDIINTALTSGRIDLYPEYTGVIVVVLAGNDEVMGSAEQTYRLAKRYEAGKGVTLLDPTPFENKNAIAVTADFAAENDVKTISDLHGIGEFLYSTYPDNVTGGLSRGVCYPESCSAGVCNGGLRADFLGIIIGALRVGGSCRRLRSRAVRDRAWRCRLSGSLREPSGCRPTRRCSWLRYWHGRGTP